MVPRMRRAESRDQLPPVVVIAEDAGARDGRTRAHHVLGQLEGCLRGGHEQLVPYVRVGADAMREAPRAAPPSIGLAGGWRATIPRGGAVPLPESTLMRDLVAPALDEEAPPMRGEQAIRDCCYDKYLERNATQNGLRKTGGDSDAGSASASPWVALGADHRAATAHPPAASPAMGAPVRPPLQGAHSVVREPAGLHRQSSGRESLRQRRQPVMSRRAGSAHAAYEEMLLRARLTDLRCRRAVRLVFALAEATHRPLGE